MKEYKVQYKTVKAPQKDGPGTPVPLSDATIEERKKKVLARMEKAGIEQLVVYGDTEHSGNFEYLIGFFTRFEEGLLVIKADGRMNLVLGNENLNKAPKARVEAGCVHVPAFSLPNQPCEVAKTLREQLIEAGVEPGKRTGIAGWKLFTSPYEENEKLFDVPAFIVDSIRSIAGEEMVQNATVLFIGADGVRTTNNANEIAHYEFAAALASDCMLEAMDAMEEGVSEMELGSHLNRFGQRNSVVTIASSGPRFVKANMYPTDNTVKTGDTISLTVGYRGGLSSRAGYAVRNREELPKGAQDYLERVAAPYFNSYAHWLSAIRVGMAGGELYRLVEETLPKSEFHWGLCPGHLTAEEEWLCSPIRKDSQELLRSGMLLQIDIIPAVPGYGGVSAESTIALADETLRGEIEKQYPKLWERIKARRMYLQETLGIPLPKEVLPMCSTVAYLRPYLLKKDAALVWEAKRVLRPTDERR